MRIPSMKRILDTAADIAVEALPYVGAVGGGIIGGAVLGYETGDAIHGLLTGEPASLPYSSIDPIISPRPCY